MYDLINAAVLGRGLPRAAPAIGTMAILRPHRPG
jgi:hypothetical protein